MGRDQRADLDTNWAAWLSFMADHVAGGDSQTFGAIRCCSVGVPIPLFMVHHAHRRRTGGVRAAASHRRRGGCLLDCGARAVSATGIGSCDQLDRTRRWSRRRLLDRRSSGQPDGRAGLRPDGLRNHHAVPPLRCLGLTGCRRARSAPGSCRRKGWVVSDHGCLLRRVGDQQIPVVSGHDAPGHPQEAGESHGLGLLADERDTRRGQAAGFEVVRDRADRTGAVRSNGDEHDGGDLVGVQQTGQLIAGRLDHLRWRRRHGKPARHGAALTA